MIVNRGTVVAQGSHEQLLEQPIYSQLWRGTHGSNGTLTTTVSQESE